MPDATRNEKELPRPGCNRRNRFVKFGTADLTVTLAVSAAAPIIGITHDSDLNDGERGDIVRDRLPEIEYDAAVTRGDHLTAGADGRAIPITPPGTGVTTMAQSPRSAA